MVKCGAETRDGLHRCGLERGHSGWHKCEEKNCTESFPSKLCKPETLGKKT